MPSGSVEPEPLTEQVSAAQDSSNQRAVGGVFGTGPTTTDFVRVFGAPSSSVTVNPTV